MRLETNQGALHMSYFKTGYLILTFTLMSPLSGYLISNMLPKSENKTLSVSIRLTRFVSEPYLSSLING